MNDMTQKMDQMSQLVIALREENLHAAEIPLKKKRAASETQSEGNRRTKHSYARLDFPIVQKHGMKHC